MPSVAVTTLDQLAAAVQHSYAAANELILRSSQDAASSGIATKADVAASDHQDSFVVNHNDGSTPVSIPLSQFYSNTRYYLSSMHLDLPCYTMSGKRLFRGTQAEVSEIHPYRPTLWQNLFYICHLYHVDIEVSLGGEKVSLRPASRDEAALAQPRRPPAQTNWTFSLSPQHQEQIQAYPPTVVPLIHRTSIMARAWRWLRGKAA